MKKKKYSTNEEQVSIIYFAWIWLRIKIRQNLINRFLDFRSRRPHRTFRLTRRRDSLRPFDMPGYWKFTKEVFGVFFDNKKTFFRLILIVVLFNFLFIGVLDQNFVTSLQDVLNATSGKVFSGAWGEVGKAGLLIFSTFTTGGLVRTPNQAQQIIMFLIVLFTWLSVVQICRNIFAGQKRITVRDALYNCGGPIIPMIIVAFVILIQSIPVFIAVIVSSAAFATSFISEGVEQMAFSAVMLLLVSMSLYWYVGSSFAMIIVTIPNTYPFQALKIAGDMVSQRRLPILARVIFGLIVVTVLWCLIIIPIILLMNWLNNSLSFFKVIPVIQVCMAFMTGFSIIFISCYIYMLFRKIVDNDRKY